MAAPVIETLRLSDFDFALPEALVAQKPAAERDRSRLMVLNRASGSLEHTVFSGLGKHLVPGDLLVLNDTKVFPCRLFAKKPGGGSSEIFLLAESGPNRWRALVKGGSAPGKRLLLGDGMEAEIVSSGPDGTREVLFLGVDDIKRVLPVIGKTPLPPYIKRDVDACDRERYQTVYAACEGAVAAPTAGLHFTHELLKRIEACGVQTATVTLHVGPGTFQPVRTEHISEHRMLPERYSISGTAAESITRAKAEGRRVIAVGTTSVRAVESAASGPDVLQPSAGSSDLFIYPGYRFRIVDAMITNFHLPKSTLLMLVSAFAGRERMLAAYRTAVEEQYRFYSYGDAMLIL